MASGVGEGRRGESEGKKKKITAVHKQQRPSMQGLGRYDPQTRREKRKPQGIDSQ